MYYYYYMLESDDNRISYLIFWDEPLLDILIRHRRTVYYISWTGDMNAPRYATRTLSSCLVLPR